jgi:hypothetical protein
MSRTALALLHASLGVLTVTGAVYAWMKYAMRADDPFTVVNHPWQPAMLAVHVVAAPLGVFGLGWLTGAHVWPRLRSREAPGRVSGLLLVTCGAPMILSAYVLQAAVSDVLRTTARVTHWAASGAFVLGYLTHVWIRRV